MSTQSPSPSSRRGPYSVSEESRARIRQALREHKQETGRWPTLDELRLKTKLGKTTVRRHVGALEDAHQVEISAPRREIVLLEGGAP